MSVPKVNLVGGEWDTLYALYFRGPLESGDLPSKDGHARLVERGFAETDWSNERAHAITPLGKAYYKAHLEHKAALVAKYIHVHGFMLGELKVVLRQHAVRWTTTEITVDEVLNDYADDLEFQFRGYDYTPAYEQRTYYSVNNKLKFVIQVGDRGSDAFIQVISQR